MFGNGIAIDLFIKFSIFARDFFTLRYELWGLRNLEFEIKVTYTGTHFVFSLV